MKPEIIDAIAPVYEPLIAAPTARLDTPTTNSHSESQPSPSVNTCASPKPKKPLFNTKYKLQHTDLHRNSVLTHGTNEQDRMVAQHYLLRTAFRGEFLAPIQSALKKGCIVLDMGCGPGTWTMEMSTAFPRSTFIGFDLENVYPHDIKPKNCHFRTCDLTILPLPLPDNSVDFIFQRDMNWYLKAHMWLPLLKEYLRILKPGGWIELVEPDLQTQCSGTMELLMNDKLIRAFSLRQQDPSSARRLASLLAISGFRRVESDFQSFPLGWGWLHQSHRINDSPPCSSDHDITVVGTHRSEFVRAVASQYMFLLKSLKPWLSRFMSMTDEKYDAYIEALPAEWAQMQTYTNWHCATAQKPCQTYLYHTP
ncbi:S-adenosyl-L-methionine-dependent methyltransferase [Radiomyces spectabilis]|uniref:S-adenosyl-L-methionine-dependent methyltransferase n=1 Tax=Radiomyces spectabilis TaxID=64574 RepID=UPI0022200339|nr:S-adenosyl-L-methionine-dependent methyltransferase [Radiomyces spectabilis]KAI8391331.1 S-adenosyl-L-methionine-dependent methyltransferase [Radiomyces spectabilis]